MAAAYSLIGSRACSTWRDTARDKLCHGYGERSTKPPMTYTRDGERFVCVESVLGLSGERYTREESEYDCVRDVPDTNRE